MDFTSPEKNIEHLDLSGGDKVAVFGSGAGGHSLAVCNAINNTGVIYAIDVRKDMLDKLSIETREQGCTAIQTLHANIEEVGKTGIDDHGVKAVVIPNTLFSYDDHVGIMKEASRIIVPLGKILVVDWKDSFGGIGPQPEHIILPEKVKEFAKEAGLKVLEEFDTGDHHYGIIFGKDL